MYSHARGALGALQIIIVSSLLGTTVDGARERVRERERERKRQRDRDTETQRGREEGRESECVCEREIDR